MKKLKLSLLFTLLSAFAFTLWAQINVSGANPAGSVVDRHGLLKVEGNRIVDKNGDPFVMRGMSFFWNQWEGARFYTAGSVNTLVDDWRANVVRVAVAPGQVSNNNYRTVIEQSIRRGIYVVVDFHTHAHRDSTAARQFFQTMVRDYGAYPNVLWEIFNEPCPASQSSGGNWGSCDGDNWATQIKPYSEKVIGAIRATGNQNIIIVGTADFSKRVDQPAGDATWRTWASTRNLAYAVHYYTAEAGTHHTSALRGYCQNALNNGLALLVTEFGVSEADGGQNNPGRINTQEADTWFSWLDERWIGWMNWSINDKNEAASALTSGNDNGTNWVTRASGTYIRGKLRDYGNTATTAALTVTTVGQGTVTRWPNSNTYGYGMFVEVTATPAAGWDFSGWTGAGTGGTMSDGRGRRMVGMYGTAQNLTATFVLGGNLIKSGVSNWSVTNSPTTFPTPTGAIAAASTASELALQFTNVAEIGTQLTHSYLHQNGIALKSGRRYKLTFEARGAQPRNVGVTVCNGASRTTRFLDNLPIALTAANKPFTIEFDVVTANGQDLPNGQLEFWFGGTAGNWFLGNVRLSDESAATGQPPTVDGQTSANLRAPAVKTAWSVVRTSGGLQLSGPTMSGAAVSLYDVRGRLVNKVSLKSGEILKLNKTVAPAGNYLLVVRNGSGKEVYKTRVSLVN